MNHIITIGREFGSGGRQIGQALARLLGYSYYCKNITDKVSERTNLSKEYVEQVIEQKPNFSFLGAPMRTLHTGSDFLMTPSASVMAEQSNVLKELAEQGNCVFVGRCADYILKDYNPYRIFVYADLDKRVEDCKKRDKGDENYSDKELRKLILQTDKNRAKYYNYYTGQKWGDRAYYDLMINTTKMTVDECATMLAELIKKKFEEQ